MIFLKKSQKQNDVSKINQPSISCKTLPLNRSMQIKSTYESKNYHMAWGTKRVLLLITPFASDPTGF